MQGTVRMPQATHTALKYFLGKPEAQNQHQKPSLSQQKYESKAAMLALSR